MKLVYAYTLVLALAVGFGFGRIWWVFNLHDSTLSTTIYSSSTGDVITTHSPQCSDANEVLVQFVWTRQDLKPQYFCADINQYEVFTNRLITRHIKPLRDVSR